MKYLAQFCIIMIFVFLGEVLEHVVPLPIAGSIWGLGLLFLALVTGAVKVAWVSDVADWLHSIMGLFFVAPAVAIIDIWGDIADTWIWLVILLVAAYLVTMVTTGLTADALIRDDATRARHRGQKSGGKK